MGLCGDYVMVENKPTIKEWRDFEMTMEEFKKRLEIPDKCNVRQISTIQDKKYVRVGTYVK